MVVVVVDVEENVKGPGWRLTMNLLDASLCQYKDDLSSAICKNQDTMKSHSL